jgi:hypothetical protein
MWVSDPDSSQNVAYPRLYARLPKAHGALRSYSATGVAALGLIPSLQRPRLRGSRSVPARVDHELSALGPLAGPGLRMNASALSQLGRGCFYVVKAPFSQGPECGRQSPPNSAGPRCKPHHRIETQLIISSKGGSWSFREWCFVEGVNYEGLCHSTRSVLRDEGHFEYSAVAANLSLTPRALWNFSAARGASEKTLSSSSAILHSPPYPPMTSATAHRSRCRFSPTI